MSDYQAPRGTVDILPQDQRYWRYVEQRAVDICLRFGYRRIETPVFEAAGLFARTVGQETDVVQKQTYTFEDRGGDLLTLRPEGTAPVSRAYLEHGMSSLPQPVRLYYFCPIFRYERPQAGRYRQHHQFGIEAIGDEDPLIDAEVIQIGWGLTEDLGLRGLSLVVNTIGDPACRPTYLQALKEYYRQYLPRVCEVCHTRYENNPLRLLDCKQQRCQIYIGDAPRSFDYLCSACREHWDTLQMYLKRTGIPYQVDHRLVRGLDYYTRTVFEIQPVNEGGQSSVLGGGRYDGLIQELGAHTTPGIGFGSGIERLILNLKQQSVCVKDESPRPIVIAHMGLEARAQGLELATKLRKTTLSIIIAPGSRGLRSQMRYASAMKARITIVLGEEELSKDTVAVRDMDEGTQVEIPQTALVAYLQNKSSY